MNYKILYSVVIIISILFIITIAVEIFLEDDFKPKSLFGYLLLNTILSGIISTVILERLNTKITE
jgi:hypothetical protein